METVFRDYAPQGVQFFYIYKALAHPETNGYITPFTQAERLMHVKEAQRTLGSGIPWLCDSMSNDVKHALGDAPNSEFIIDPQGVVAVRRGWSDPKQLRADLEKLVGPVEHVTQVSELNLKKLPPPKGAATGVVARLKVEGRFNPLQVTPQPSQQPFYVKLRAEADDGLLRKGEGKLYLGFLLDPLYHVHWNNLAASIKFSIQSTAMIEMTPAEGTGPKVEQAADLDPREFLVAVKLPPGTLQPGTVQPGTAPTLRVKVDYYACHDEEAWCKRVSQEYDVPLTIDRDGGWVQSRRRAGQRPSPDGRPVAGRPAAGRPQPGAAEPRPMGTVVKVDVEARTLTMRLRNGNERTVQVDANAVINHNGKDGSLSDLQAGDRILVELKRNDSDTDAPTVTRIVSRRF